MKVPLIIATFLLSCSVQQASKKVTQTIPTIPGCIEKKINAVKEDPSLTPPVQVDQYTYDGRTVFLVTNGCCDQFNEVYDEQCNYICAPSGGLTGKGDRKCPDFNDKAVLVKTVWKNNNTKK